MDRYRSPLRSWLFPFLPSGSRRPPPLSLGEPLPVDLARLDELRASGSKMKLPHPIRNHVRFPGQQEARAAMETLRAEGYSVQVRADAEDSWRVTCVISLVPTPAAVTHMREQLEALAQSLDGEYSGWECPLVY
jgi:Regulator of ribonuclease activity B